MTAEIEAVLAWVILIGLGIIFPLIAESKRKPEDGEKFTLKPSLKLSKEVGRILWPKHPYIALAIYDSIIIWAIYVLVTTP